MQKYEKPHARNLGDLMPVLGQCWYGQSASPGPYNPCQNGVGATSYLGRCVGGTLASGDECRFGEHARNTCNEGLTPNYLP